MRTGIYFAAVAALAGGCFDEGEEAGNTAAAQTMADGLLAFPDISQNLQTDAGATATALLAFIKTPIAANNLVAPPFDLGTMNAMLAEEPAPIPDCLTTMGEPSCDSFVTNMTCEAGNFTFSGDASRACTPCDNPEGSCTYNWGLDLSYVKSGFSLKVHTTGPATVIAAEVHYGTDWNFDFTSSGYITGGNLHIESCGNATVDKGPPRRLVNSQFFVAAQDKSGHYLGVCAHVFWDAKGNPSVKKGKNDRTTCGCL